MKKQKLNLLFGLYCLAVFLLALGQFAVLSRGGESNVYLFDFGVAAFAAYGLAFFLIRRKFFIPRPFLFFGLFFGVATISLLKELTTLPTSDFIFSAFYLVRLGIYLLAAVVCFNAIEQKIINLASFLKVLFFAAFLLSVAGFVQLAILPDFTHKNRLASTFFDPNFMGGFLALSTGIAVGAALLKKLKFSVLEAFLYIGVPLLALFLTFSRSAWAAFAVVVFVLGVFRVRKLLFLGLFLAFLAYFAVPRVQTRISGITDPADSAAFRLVSWKNSLEIAQDNLFLGVGYNAYRYAQKDYGFFEPGELGGNAGAGADSSLLFVLATTGILGLIPFLLGLTTSFVGMEERDWGIIILAVISGIILQSQFINALFYPQIMFFWLPLLALAATSRLRK